MDSAVPSGPVERSGHVTGAGWTRATLFAVLLGLLLCGGGLTWNASVAPLMDDSDPSTFIGSGLLLFGIPAFATAVAAATTRFLAGRLTVLSHGLTIASLAIGTAAVVGLVGYELLFSRTLWS